MTKKIWIDITNTPQVHFLYAIAQSLNKTDYSIAYSIRDFSESMSLLEHYKINDYFIFGRHHGKNRLYKAFGLINRFREIFFNGPDFDISLSCGSDGAIWTSWLKGKKSIAFGDNDLAKQWTYARFVDFAFFPDSIDKRVLTRQGLSEERIFLYPGYKEDIYLADYIPHVEFVSSLPFTDYVLVRPENLMANYINKNQNKTITPELLKLLSSKGLNILYLPRYKSDRLFCKDIKNVFVPATPINGIDAVHFSKGVFTGAGTFAREAACLGIPAFSFFSGKKLLAVDLKLIAEGKMVFSRNPGELVNSFIKSEKSSIDLNRSKLVKKIVLEKLTHVITNLSQK